MKKTKINLNILLIIIVVLFCITFLLFSYLSYKRIVKMASAFSINQSPTIVLDAGHGGEDGGAISKSGLQEKNINLAIALKLKDMFTLSGYHVVMTRETDIAINDENLDTIHERKASDIRNRVKIVENQENCILVSIHQNDFSESKYYGSQIFYSTKNDQSKTLAEIIQSSIVKLLQPENKRQVKPAKNTIYLLWHTHVPAVIVECGFLSNASEAKKLSTELYQKQMAFAIYNAILSYLCENN